MQLVQDTSKITFSKADLLNPGNAQSITWSQGLRTRTENFVEIIAKLTTCHSSSVLLFVQHSLVNQLLDAAAPTLPDGDQREVVVQPPWFRYGRDNAANTAFRFLIYLDPAFVPFQHRFINQTTVSKLASLAGKLPDLTPYVTSARRVLEIAGSVIGDPLRSFEG